jgi:6-phosphogluconolactonase
MKKKTTADIYIASSVPDGGILRYRLSSGGELKLIDKLALPTPNWIERRGNVMYVTCRNPFPDSDESGVVRLSVRQDGSLVQDGEFLPTGGRSSCHVAFEGEDVYVANYSSGSITKMGNPPLCHAGRGVNPERQEMPHCHGAFFSPDRRYILVCDLGLDTVFVYDRELREISRARVPDGEGCRHLVFSRDGRFVYVENELGCSVSVFRWEDGRLIYRSTLPTRNYRPHQGENKGAAIKLSRDGKRLYITNRGENEALMLSVRGEKLRVRQRIPTEGDEPRDIGLLFGERFAIVTNQFSDSVSLYRLSRIRRGRMKLLQTLEIPAPLAVTE